MAAVHGRPFTGGGSQTAVHRRRLTDGDDVEINHKFSKVLGRDSLFQLRISLRCGITIGYFLRYKKSTLEDVEIPKKNIVKKQPVISISDLLALRLISDQINIHTSNLQNINKYTTVYRNK
ncbi:8434_t:CDS:2 [Acaulospora morrowiae]|uniref:8434_t:CDS:1 n=1 Tax=Acaulospora morrowiae TaxID=94023 RepID=A0A9N8YZE6_9GLOM|nr:8434_t:CDS:2 [Acaulospora morrowiae]